MRSLILTLSYLLKDTWLRWFEQPGSILARVLVTTVMTSLSIMLLVAINLQIIKLERQVEKIGLDSIVVIEAIRIDSVEQNLKQSRFRFLEDWGELVILQKLPYAAYGAGKRANVMAYDEESLPALKQYLDHGHSYFFLSKDFPEGALVDFELDGHYLKAVALHPEDKFSQVISGNFLFIPMEAFYHLAERGFSRINYLNREKDSPSIKDITGSIEHVIETDRIGNVEVRSALSLTEKIDVMRKQLNQSTLGLSLVLGAALALIYGTLSVLEFRQSMYISALLNSFGASKFILFMRTLMENLFVVNATALILIYLLERYHDEIYSLFKFDLEISDGVLRQLYWGEESVWTFVFINIGVTLSCIPVLIAMRKQVGRVLN